MPSPDTFDCEPIKGFVQKYLLQSKVSVDPFARNKRWATHTNDVNPKTAAQRHMDAEDFCKALSSEGVTADLVIFDPPYSPRQISECYAEAGLACGMMETQNAALYARVKKAMAPLITKSGTVLSFGWNSAGMGKDFEILEVLLVCHGGAHNDTICMAEKRKIEEANLL